MSTQAKDAAVHAPGLSSIPPTNAHGLPAVTVGTRWTREFLVAWFVQSDRTVEIRPQRRRGAEFVSNALSVLVGSEVRWSRQSSGLYLVIRPESPPGNAEPQLGPRRRTTTRPHSAAKQDVRSRKGAGASCSQSPRTMPCGPPPDVLSIVEPKMTTLAWLRTPEPPPRASPGFPHAQQDLLRLYYSAPSLGRRLRQALWLLSSAAPQGLPLRNPRLL